MRYISTNRRAPEVSFSQALLQGIAPDKGLYLPAQLPTFSAEQIEGWREQSYASIANDIMTPFVDGEIPADALRHLCEDAYNFPVPLEQVDAKRYVMRLDQGPTASFKDFAARAMARLMSHFLQQNGRELLILTATSGDTGSAIAHAFHQVPGIRVVILFPIDEVSQRQRKQMTTLGGNISVLAIDGKFDDCQGMVKHAFADPTLSQLPLSSANSINIGRLIPQSVYYAYAYSRLVTPPEQILFSIPCGNFGNMMGAMLAWRMGLPIQRLLIAVNANDEVPQFLESGTYQKIEPSRNCLSNAMNVGHPSNFARLVQLYDGQIDQDGIFQQPPQLDKMRQDLFSMTVSDQQTREAISAAYQDHKLLLEPHGAVAWHALEIYRQTHPEANQTTAVSIETAHPAKFPDAIQTLLGIDPTIPPALATIEQKTEQYDTMANHYGDFARYLRRL